MANSRRHVAHVPYRLDVLTVHVGLVDARDGFSRAGYAIYAARIFTAIPIFVEFMNRQYHFCNLKPGPTNWAMSRLVSSVTSTFVVEWSRAPWV